ncbi:dipeptide epimerase [Candidatus Bathyarchaeota archaeon]|nr:dipeptide epimerase [Candidatus Bathyarchaeota archaeon]
MGIQQIEVYTAAMRYEEPFTIAAGTSTKTCNVIVRVLTDYEIYGWGEASPSKRVTGETTETVIEALDKICPKLIGKCPLRIESDVEIMDQVISGNPAAKAAIDIALHDVLGKTARKPLFRILGGYRTEVLTDITLGIKSPKEMAQNAKKALDKGFKALKIKVGVDVDEDVERIRLVREVAGNDIQLRVDANQGWTPKQAMEALNKISRYNIQLAEQPVPSEDIEGLKNVKKNSPVPIMADESVHTPADALRLVREGAVDMMNIKLMKCGGILKAKKIAAVAEAAGMPCMIGCMSESSIGIAAATHLAGAVKNIQYADLDSDILLKDKITTEGGVPLVNSVRKFTNGHGLGIETVDTEFLGKPLRIYK